MRTSSHTAAVSMAPYNGFLLFHTVRGSLDIVPAEIGIALDGLSNRDRIEELTDSETDLLKRRGYLTEEPAEAEFATARQLLKLSAEHTTYDVVLSLRFTDNPLGHGSAKCDIERALDICM